MFSAWNVGRLQSAMRRHFAARSLIVVSNREPCAHELQTDGTVVPTRPASGLVTALDPVLAAIGGTWVAHGSGSADRAVVDREDRVELTGRDGTGRYTLRRVWLSRGEERGYYDGFSNSALWPLCHVSFEPPRVTRSDWRHYQEVNRRFADAVAAESSSPRPIVFVHDYHLALLPALIRERLPDAVVVAFWHIPWPDADRFARLPYGGEIVEGLLGSDLIGFQTTSHVQRFLECADAIGCGAVDRTTAIVGRPHGEVPVRAYPISVQWPSPWDASAPSVDDCRRAVRLELGVDPDTPLMLSVDRMDYTKGIEERLSAIRRLLARGNATVGRPVFLQIAAPSRARHERYRRLAQRVRDQVAAINARFGAADYRPIVLRESVTTPEDVFRYYRAADACHVNSLDDGMNLVAKEFVAARCDERGALVLSTFTGAARELAGAITINPYDLDGVADAIANALTLAPDEQQRRMRLMRRQVEAHNIMRWAARLLLDAAEVRPDAPFRRLSAGQAHAAGSDTPDRREAAG